MKRGEKSHASGPERATQREVSLHKNMKRRERL